MENPGFTELQLAASILDTTPDELGLLTGQLLHQLRAMKENSVELAVPDPALARSEALHAFTVDCVAISVLSTAVLKIAVAVQTSAPT